MTRAWASRSARPAVAAAGRGRGARPTADWPPSLIQSPGSTAPQYGPQTPGVSRGAAASAITQEEVPPISARWRSSSGRRELAEHAEGAGVRVDEAGGDAGRRVEAEVGGGRRRQRPEVGADRRRARRLAGAGERGRRGRCGRGSPPASPGSRGRGSPTCRRACTASGPGCRWRAQVEEVGEVEGVGDARPARGEVALEPEQLRELHLGRQRRRRRGRGPRWGPAAVIAAASAPARWSSQRMVSRRSSPLVETVTGRAGARRGGPASRWRRRRGRRRLGRRGAGLGAGGAQGGGGGLPDLGARTARRGPRRSSWMSIGASARPRRRPAAVEEAGPGAAGADVDGGDEHGSRLATRRSPAAPR